MPPALLIALLSTLAMAAGLWFTHLVHSQARIEDQVLDLAPPTEGQSALVSVIVPARNEARSIGACVRALLQQTYPNFEVIVVDDRSSDATPQVLAELSVNEPRLRVVQGEALPEGWAGKPHALHQGVRAASPPGGRREAWLCFIDADTFAAPDLLRLCLATAQASRADLFSILTEQELGGFWEKVIMPLIFTALSFGFSPQRVNDPENPEAIANGQFILIRREVYQAVGGHTALSDSLVEDKDLAVLVKRRGYRLLVADGRRLARTRMYTSLAGIWEGWTKNMYVGLQDRLWLLLLGALTGLAGAMGLPLWLGGGLAWYLRTGEALAGLVALEAGAVWAVLLWKRVQANREGGISTWYALSLPLGALLFTSMLLVSAYNVVSGKGVTWKGRRYRP